jgi:hypothetical protein
MCSLQHNQRRGYNKFCPEARGEGEGEGNTIYTHVSKCSNDKIKGEKKERINETKNYFFKRINKINKLLPNMTKQREKTQFNTIKDEM